MMKDRRRSVAGRRARRKGKEGELWVGRWLYQQWFGDTPSKDRVWFVRTKLGVRQQQGDLTVPPDFPALVEVKNRVIHPCLHFPALTDYCQTLRNKVVAAGKQFGLLFVRLNRRQWACWFVKPSYARTALPFFVPTLSLISYARLFVAIYTTLKELSVVLKALKGQAEQATSQNTAGV